MVKPVFLSLLLCATAAQAAFTNLSVARFGAGTLNVLPLTVTDWALRVVANGGAMPSDDTIRAMDTFRTGIIADGLSNQMVSVCVFVPDSLTAALTPIFDVYGYKMWTNFNFVSGDLTINGLKGNGTTKYLQPAVVPDSVPASTGFGDDSAGVSYIVSVNPSSAATVDFGVGVNSASRQWALENSLGTIYYFCWGFASTQDYATFAAPSPGGTWTGFLSGNRTSGTSISIYRASTTLTFGLGANGTGVQKANVVGGYSLPVTWFAVSDSGAVRQWSANTLSFAAIHAGLTSVQASNLYVRASALRVKLGGGNP
jgi:hypothetical protein